MRLGSVATLVLLLSLLSLPLAAAQAPPLPPVPADPGEAVALACDAVGQVDPTVRDALPPCDRPDPAAPVPGEEDPHAHPPAPAPAPAVPGDVEGLAADAVEEASAIPEDPAGAPERIASILAAVVDFVRELLGLPLRGLENAGAALEALGGALTAAGEAAGEAAGSAIDATKQAATGAVDATKQAAGDLGARITALLESLRPADAPRAPAREPGAVDDARETADGLLELARGQVGQVLAEGQ